MNNRRILKVLKTLRITNIRDESHGIRCSCPFSFQHFGGTDDRPSMFIFATDKDESRSSYASCHTCGFKGSIEKLAWEYQKAKGLKNNHLLEMVEKLEIDEFDEVDELSYEDIPKFAKRNPSVMGAIRKSSKLINKWIELPDGQKFQTLNNNEYCKISELQVYKMVIPFVKDIPDYVLKRGITREVALKFDLGFQKEVRYFTIKNNKRYYLYFGDRLLIPIKNHNGEFVGWSARALSNEKKDMEVKDFKGLPEYNMFNSPKYYHMPAFKRNNYLYGEHLIDEKNKTCILCEGFFDVIKLFQCGYGNALGVMGTALSDAQVKTIRRFFNTVCIFMDGDKAGQDAAEKITKQLSGLRIVRINAPEGKDPADMSYNEIEELFMDSF